MVGGEYSIDLEYVPDVDEEVKHRKKYPKVGRPKKKDPQEIAFVITLKRAPEFQKNFPGKGKSRIRGKTQDSFSLQEFICLLLWNNEHLPTNRKMSDELLVKILYAEYPNSSWAKQLISGKKKFAAIRGHYNNGYLTDGVAPSVRSFRYTEYGEKANYRTGRPLRDNQGVQQKRRVSKKWKWNPDGTSADARTHYGPAVDGAYDGSEGSDYL